jgi:MFS transporter, MCT family, solute carrier family 16 (monocarboxylic acid transporters), member 10
VGVRGWDHPLPVRFVWPNQRVRSFWPRIERFTRWSWLRKTVTDVYSLGTFQYQYEMNQLRSASTSSIAWILTMQLFLMFFLSQPVGVLVDVFGPRMVLIPAAALEVLGLIGLSFSTQYYQIFLAQSVCFGVGAAGVFVPGERLYAFVVHLKLIDS